MNTTTARMRYKTKRIKGKQYYVHRLVWEKHNGPIPTGMQIHHINGNIHDNRIANLELVSPSKHNSVHKTITATHRECIDCNQTFSIDNFPVSKKNKITGTITRRPRCRECFKAYDLDKWHKRRRE